MNRLGPLLFVLLAACCLTLPARAQVRTVRLASGLVNPTWAGAPAGDPRIFVTEKRGILRVIEDGVLLPAPFLDIADLVISPGEQGFLGVAFHPDYANNGWLFVNFTDNDGDTVIARYTASASDPNVADPRSGVLVLSFVQPFANHNGGCLQFGPDGYLYIATGDGGLAGDPACRAQRLVTPLGKMLRIDVDTLPYAIPPSNPYLGDANARQEILHLGLRNPWRFSFDRATGDLWIGDVGQGAREEVNAVPAGSSNLNFGWKIMEGTRCNQTSACTDPIPCQDTRFTDPVFELIQTSAVDSPRAIIGGFVYRGCALPSEVGRYFFSDNSDAKIRSLRYDFVTGQVLEILDRTAEFEPGGGLTIRGITAFGEDGFGELLVVDGSGANGELYKMVPVGAAAARRVFENGSGLNDPCFDASPPILGGSWHASVDVTGHPGATTSFIYGYDQPGLALPLAGSELLLAGNLVFRRFRASAGGVDEYREPLPCDPALQGITTYTQALIVGGAPPSLCNRMDLTVGYF